MTDVILSPISLDSLEQLIKRSVISALTFSQPTAATPADDSETFTISELADYLNCTKATIHAYKKRGVFPYYQTGRTVFFKKKEVDQALEVGNKRKGGTK